MTPEGRDPRVPSGFEDILTKKGFAHLATVTPDGLPHSTPVWYDWDGAHLLVSTTKDRKKYRTLVRSPSVAVSITDPDDPYRSLQIQGWATMEDDPDARLIDALSRKYLGRPWSEDGRERVIVKITPTHVTTYG